ncbi:MAG TPA: hypothetical protein PKY59_03465 [Pyrinomonadaceae bacterium]|nr:hypothetical protein [Pyrinomonadaceae bacterium]
MAQLPFQNARSVFKTEKASSKSVKPPSKPANLTTQYANRH